jgi:hypothetical protein
MIVVVALHIKSRVGGVTDADSVLNYNTIQVGNL